MAKQLRRVLVLGATGHVGQAIVRHARERERDVTAVTRRANPESLRGLGVKILRTDREAGSLTDAAAGHDLVVFAEAPYLLDLSVPESAQWRAQCDAALKRAQLAIEAARRNGIPLVFVSSYGTVPRHEPPPAVDGVLWRRLACPYYEAKTAMEQAVMAAAREGLRTVIVNPVTFVGPWVFRDDTWNFVSRALKGILPAVIDQVMAVIDVRDVAEAIDLALSREFFGRQIPLSGHNIHPADLVARTAALAGLPPVRPWAVPGFLASAGSYWTHMAFTAFGFAAPAYLGVVAISPEIMPAPPSREQMALGVRIRPLEESLRDAVRFHLAL